MIIINLSQSDFNAIINPNMLVSSYDIQGNVSKKGFRIYRKCDGALFIDKVFSRQQSCRTYLRKIMMPSIKDEIIKALNVKSWYDIAYDGRKWLLGYNNPTLWNTIYDEFEFRKI